MMNEIMDMIMQMSEDIELMKANLLEMQRQKAEGLGLNWIDGQEVRETLHISKRKLQTLRDNGTLPYSRVGGKLYYKVSDVKAVLDKSYSPKK